MSLLLKKCNREIEKFQKNLPIWHRIFRGSLYLQLFLSHEHLQSFRVSHISNQAPKSIRKYQTMLCHTKHNGDQRKVSSSDLLWEQGNACLREQGTTIWRSCQRPLWQSGLSCWPVPVAALLLQVGELLCCFQSFLSSRLACQKISEPQGLTQRRRKRHGVCGQGPEAG